MKRKTKKESAMVGRTAASESQSRRVESPKTIRQLTEEEAAIIVALRAARAPVKTAGKEDPKAIDWTKVLAKCPKCSLTKVVEPDFGTKPSRDGERKRQSWCKACRAGTNYYNQPRKYKTRNTQQS